MSITNEERAVLVQLQRDKAENLLKQAEFMCSNELWDMAANRFYYGMYHLAQALLISKGLSAHSHAGLLNLFHMHFVKAGTVSRELGGFFSRMEQMRERADYNCAYDVTESEIAQIRPYVQEFFRIIKGLLDDNKQTLM